MVYFRLLFGAIFDENAMFSISDYDSLRKKFIEGNTDVTISWRFENGFVCVKNDEERHRPELYFMLKAITGQGDRFDLLRRL